MSRPDRYTCEQFFRRLPEFLDAELGSAEAASMREHLEWCSVCLEEYQFERDLLEEVRHKLKPVEEAPAGLLERIGKLLREDEAAG